MSLRLATALFAVCTCTRLSAAVPTPREHFGFTPGDERELANYKQLVTYFEKLAKASDRIQLREFGRSSAGKPMYAAFISSRDNLRRLDDYREINQKLALGLPADPAEAHRLAAQGKVFVWIDSGLHASEVAPSQQAPELAYQMVTDESQDARRIRDNVILIQIPCINPDGLDQVVAWYRSNLGTPYELAPLPRLYQKYAGHDNNRDYYMLNLAETRNVTALLFQQWFPQIVYNQHQAPPFPARIFVPPYAEPLNPNIPAPVMEGINMIGGAIRERFARAGQPGVLSYWGFDAWWNGGLRSVPAFHNMHGILTETAGYLYGNSKNYMAAELPERFGNGLPTKDPTVFYERPWMGGKWGVRQAIDYMLTVDRAILDLASTRAPQFLYKAWEMARANIDGAAGNGKPWAYIIPRDQADRMSTKALAWRLQYAGIRVERASTGFNANGRQYPEGTIVIRTAQPFRGYLVDLMEPQRYPELRSGVSGPTKRPYDIAGWTLPMQMGVDVDRTESSVNVPLEENPLEMEPQESEDHRDNGFFLTMSRLLKQGAKVRWSREGRLLRSGDSDFAKGAYEFSPPKVAVYEPWTANVDSGWTAWLLDAFHVPHSMIHNDDFRKGNLRARFDTLILAAQSANSILNGIREGERNESQPPRDTENVLQRPEYTGGIGLPGLVALDEFVRAGGTLLTFDTATELPVQHFPLPVRLLLHPVAGTRDSEAPAGYYCPGSILRIAVDNEHPIAFGMLNEAYAFSSGGQAFDITLLPQFNRGDREIKTIAKYADHNLLASGWISGERAVLGRPILLEARHGDGKVILFGFRPQHRGQTFGTFKLVLNSIFLGSSKVL